MKGLAAACVVLCSAGFVRSGEPQEIVAAFQGMQVQESSPAAAGGTTLVFAYKSRIPGEAPWEIVIAADQSGSYQEQTEGVPPQVLHVSHAVWERLQAATGAVRSGRCETRQKGIAQTGVKTLSLKAGTQLASCTFNFSDNDALNDAAAAFIALAETLHAGAKLQHEHRFDRLALDAEMDALLADIAGGRALEPGNIAPVLQSIVDDDRVIDRVRRKAARLLQSAAPTADKPR